jgi:hypothetical protein
MNKSQVRAIKNDRYSYSYHYDEYEDEDYRQLDRASIPRSAPHAPNKNEGRALRRIMAQTGLTADEVMERKCYRVEIAQASNPRKGTNRSALMRKRILRYHAASLGLPTWHPDVLKSKTY